MNVKEDVLYLPSHEWVKIEDDTAWIGISDYAQHALGDIVYVSLPDVDDQVDKGKSFCDIESVKAVSDVYSPVSGVIVAVNQELEDTPEKLNEDPYATWIVKVKGTFDTSDLLDAQAYQELLKQEG